MRTITEVIERGAGRFTMISLHEDGKVIITRHRTAAERDIEYCRTRMHASRDLVAIGRGVKNGSMTAQGDVAID